MGLDWLVDFKKPNFNGRRALAEEKRKGSTWRLVKLDIEGNKVANASYIYEKQKNNKAHIGFITSAEWSPICKQNVALGTVLTPHGAVGSKVYVEIYYQREMHWNRAMAEATVVDPAAPQQIAVVQQIHHVPGREVALPAMHDGALHVEQEDIPRLDALLLHARRRNVHAIGVTDPELYEAARWAHSRLPEADRPGFSDALQAWKDDPSAAPLVLRPHLAPAPAPLLAR